MKYRKKPVEIEAFKYGFEPVPEWFAKSDMVKEATPNYCIIHTLEGDHRGDYGDYIIQGVKGELYPCKPDIFHQTYDKVIFE